MTLLDYVRAAIVFVFVAFFIYVVFIDPSKCTPVNVILVFVGLSVEYLILRYKVNLLEVQLSEKGTLLMEKANNLNQERIKKRDKKRYSKSYDDFKDPDEGMDPTIHPFRLRGQNGKRER